ncbi:hypothetical protein WR25_20337 [Diploscapter pachys]|uniref:Potassium channel domain-containing protein n=1 Tax=Diploscapter pachys TaxID=2018661 RepID=A0A2A2JPE7_9BILA|nr:hypothetical protein WR25_20337 [Diploscapter pachys]
MRAATNVETERNRLSRLLRLRQSFREQVYHDYGLKHVCLILVLVLYQFLGAGIFYWCEADFDENKEQLWNEAIAENRISFVSDIVPLLFNNTKYLFFLSMNQTKEVTTTLSQEIVRYEKQLGIKYTDQKIKWDFWNAMLYAQTICTTIGYGHLYPSTPAGRIFTMIYAIFGIPLVLSILDDLGKLLTKCLKTPWWLLKCGCRRAFRYCTKQTLAEIRKLDEEDKRGKWNVHSVFRSSSSAHSLSKEAIQAALMGKKFTHKSTQTTMSLPQSSGGSTTMAAMTRTVSGNHFRVLPRTLSIDDVMRMVDTEDGDILVLTELSREDESSISDETHMTRTVSATSSVDDNSSQIVVSKSFDAKFGSAIKPPHSLPISSFIG